MSSEKFIIVEPTLEQSIPDWFPVLITDCLASLNDRLKYLTINCHNQNETIPLNIFKLMGGSPKEDYEISCSLFPESAILSTEELLSAFGYSEYNDFLYSTENQQILDNFGGEVAKSGVFLRYKDFLNFHVGSLPNSENAVLVSLDNGIREAVQSFVGLSH